MATKTIDNFGGRLTRYVDGDMNSGFAKYSTTFGNDPFVQPGNLSWFEQPTRIDSGGTVITDLIVAGKERVESGISYVYAIGHTGRLYKIQVNDPTTYNPSYDNPVLLATLTAETPTFTRGGSMDFFGSTERIYIGHDKGVTRIDFNGLNETFVGTLGSWTQTVPRPMKQFVGKLYASNGSNLAEINADATVATYARLEPAFPVGTQVRDIDYSLDGLYLEMVVTRLALPDITVTTQDTTFLSNSESYVFKWNGIDAGYAAYDYYPSFSLNANQTFGSRQFAFGYDLAGACVFSGTEKILSNALSEAPLPNAASSNGNIVGYIVPEFVAGFLKASLLLYGPLDYEVTTGWWRQMQTGATSPETNILKVPFQLIVSNFGIGPASNGYTSGVFSTAKIYFSTLETSPAPTVDYKLYKFNPVATGQGTTIAGVYETQSQLFSKKIKPDQIRIYAEPWVANNEFKIDLIGSDGNPIQGGTKTFTAGSNLTVGDDFAWYTPQMEPTYVLGVRITNIGSANHIISKIEIDYSEAGQ